VKSLRLLVLSLLLLPCVQAAPSELATRGYTVLPQPQRVTLRSGDFKFGAGWSVTGDDVAVAALNEGLGARFKIAPLRAGAGNALSLVIAPGSVEIGDALDNDKKAIADQAYRIDAAPSAITITANAAPGLFYGVQTLLQLLKPKEGALWLPEAQIVDWPDLRLRQIYWDDAHHLDRPEVLREVVNRAAFYKLNGVVIKFDGHFQYASAPAVVEPYAISPAELQALTDYALKRHVQIMPFLDGPGHVAFLLKHPQYAKLRAFPDSNYEICTVNPDTYKFYEGLFQDLLNANKGSKYFYLSTDEPYYVGMSDNAQCNEAARTRELGTVGKVLAEFITKTAGWLHDNGREVVFWGEYPLKPDDIESLPKFMINGEVYGPKYDPVYKKHGIRQTIYTSIQGEERHFPMYFPLPAEKRLHTGGRAGRGGAGGKVAQVFRGLSTNPARKNAELIGVVNAGWADSGLHPETFWLGYAAGTAAGWRPNSPDPEESVDNFYKLFYGRNAVEMDRVYHLMSTQSQFWSDSWETGPSKSRKGIWGNSDRIYTPRKDANDQYISLPAAPNAELKQDGKWSTDNARRLELAAGMVAESDELIALLGKNLKAADYNRYNIEVMLSIAQVMRHNLTMLAAIGKIDKLLASASSNPPRQALAAVDEALTLTRTIRNQRNALLKSVTETWYKAWYPRVPEANGRKFLHELDDVKDHVGDRTVDLSYMVQREILLPVGDWVEGVQSARNKFARSHNLPASNQTFDWKDTKAVK
jgi:hypothetical protein